jgi:hypothetical protein
MVGFGVSRAGAAAAAVDAVNRPTAAVAASATAMFLIFITAPGSQW